MASTTVIQKAGSSLPDIFSYEIVDAMAYAGCPFCRAAAADDRRWMETFRREGKDARELRLSFFGAGGFCRHHAWLFHRVVVDQGSGAAVADVYGWLAERDLAWFESFLVGAVRGRRNRSRRLTLRRRERCPACIAYEASAERRAHFFVDVLGEDVVRRRYVRSDGLCFTHLAVVIEQVSDVAPDTVRFVLGDWRGRLAEVRKQLAEYDRKRDHRYSHEPKGAEQRAWTEVIRRYVGEELTRGPQESQRHGT